MQVFPSKIVFWAFVWLCVFFAFSNSIHAESTADYDILGLWDTQDHDGVIEIYPCDHLICGRFYWLKYDKKHGTPKDDQNPDISKRDRPLCHMQFMGGFMPDGSEHYNKGWIYNPEDGHIYSAIMTLADHNTLNLHGYVLHPLFGESQVWTRRETAPSCDVDER